MSGVPTALALGSYAAQVFRDQPLTWLDSVARGRGRSGAHRAPASLVIASGFFSLEGGVTIVIPGMLFAWILGTSIVLLRMTIKGDDELVAGC